MKRSKPTWSSCCPIRILISRTGANKEEVEHLDKRVALIEERICCMRRKMHLLSDKRQGSAAHKSRHVHSQDGRFRQAQSHCSRPRYTQTSEIKLEPNPVRENRMSSTPFNECSGYTETDTSGTIPLDSYSDSWDGRGNNASKETVGNRTCHNSVAQSPCHKPILKDIDLHPQSCADQSHSSSKDLKYKICSELRKPCKERKNVMKSLVKEAIKHQKQCLKMQEFQLEKALYKDIKQCKKGHAKKNSCSIIKEVDIEPHKSKCGTNEKCGCQESEETLNVKDLNVAMDQAVQKCIENSLDKHLKEAIENCFKQYCGKMQQQNTCESSDHVSHDNICEENSSVVRHVQIVEPRYNYQTAIKQEDFCRPNRGSNRGNFRFLSENNNFKKPNFKSRCKEMRLSLINIHKWKSSSAPANAADEELMNNVTNKKVTLIPFNANCLNSQTNKRFRLDSIANKIMLTKGNAFSFKGRK